MDKVGLCNMALGFLGISQQIGNIDEQSNEARVCRVYFDQARDEALEAMPWSFAKSYVDLQDIGSPPAKWLYRYRYPSNCLKARAVGPRGYIPDVSTYYNLTTLQYQHRDAFEIIEDEDNGGLAICSNMPAASLTFTKRIKQITLYPASFRVCFAWLLATYLASPLSAQAGMAEKAAQAYRNALLQAAALMLNEGGEILERESEFITERY
jgi:hypothetical protein